MADGPRSYGEGCLAAHALDLVGDRWALLVVRELMFGPKRFGAIRQRLPGIATNMLTRRLTDLETAGVLVRREMPPPASVTVYELTHAGLGLGPVIRELCRWAVTVPGHDHRLPISPMALMLSMQAMMMPGGGDFTAGFDIQGERFVVTVQGDRIDTRRADPPQAELQFSGTGNDLAVAVYGPQPLRQVVQQGLIGFQGDPGAGQAFIDRFRLAPQPGD